MPQGQVSVTPDDGLSTRQRGYGRLSNGRTVSLFVSGDEAGPVVVSLVAGHSASAIITDDVVTASTALSPGCSVYSTNRMCASS